MPFSDSCFDVVIDFGTCFHISRPEAGLSEIARVLGEGGVLIHETPLSQLLAHPCRAGARRLPWAATPELAPCGTALLWSRRVNRGSGEGCTRRPLRGRTEA
jgi:SAM-dependent methyltransferase